MRSASLHPARAPASRHRPPARGGGRTALALTGLVAALLVLDGGDARAQFLRGTLDAREKARPDDPTRTVRTDTEPTVTVAPDLLGLGETISPVDPATLAEAAKAGSTASSAASSATSSADPTRSSGTTTGTAPGTTTGTVDPLASKTRTGATAASAKTGGLRGPVARVLPAASPEGSRPVQAAAAIQPAVRDPDPKTAEEAVKEDDGYAPLGLRTGGMTWLPAVEIGVGRKTNVDSMRGGRASSSFSVEPELVGRSDWARHALDVNLRGSWVAYPQASDQSRPQYHAEARGRLDLGDLTRADLTAAWTRRRESVSATEAASGGDGTDRETKTLGLGITRDVGLVGLTLRGEMERSDYFANGTLTVGSTDPGIQNNTRWVGAFRTTVGPSDAIAPFVEVQTGIRRYDARLVYGQRRDGAGAAAKVGVAIDAGPTLRGEISTGWGFEKPADGALATLSGWLIDGRLTWSPTRLVVVKTQVKTGFEPTTNAGSPGSIARSLTVDVDWSLRRDLTASIGGGLDTKHYFGIGVDERTAILTAGLTYKFDRGIQTFVRGRLEHVTASNAASYDVGTVITGVRIQR